MSRSVRVVIVQPSLAKYRVPVFRELARRPGIDLTVVYGRVADLPNEPADGFHAIFEPYWRMPDRPLYWQGSQWRWATRRRADVLILPWDLHYLTLLPAMLRARANGVATILWGHGYSKTESAIRGRLRRAAGRLATALLFYSRSVAERHVLEWDFDPRHLFVAANALDQAPIKAAREHWLADPHRLDLFQIKHDLKDRPVVLFVARIDRERRLDLLISAAARLSTEFSRLRVVIIGKGPTRGELERQARELGIAERVVFPGAMYDEMELAPWFLSAKVFCFPANLGLSILHAFGYGLPVVTSDRAEGHGPEFEALSSGETGLLFRDGDAADLAKALGRLLKDEGLAGPMACRALETVEQGYSLRRMVDGFVEAIGCCHEPPTALRNRA